jgi:prepilin-type N-terminal cleavage/methylation domain-containing protein
MKERSSGFTLIELLIVVAIIGILAAIAIPNFLQAQIRAKVAKSHAEMQSVGTALELYHVDHSSYPVPYNHPLRPAWKYNVPNDLTTPIAYLSNAEAFFDPFSLFETMDPDDPRYQFHRYGYINTDYTRATGLPFNFVTPAFEMNIGKWRLDGYGPARSSPGSWPYYPTYDPTNGTISWGAIYRSQKDPEGIQN